MLDRRVWLPTDRPGEQMTVSVPLNGVRVMSARGSTRHCVELHETHTLCLIAPEQQAVGTNWRSGASSTLETGSGDLMVMELGEVHRTQRVYGSVSFSVVQVEPILVDEVAEELGITRVPGVRAASVSHPALRADFVHFVLGVAACVDATELRSRLVALIRSWLVVCGKVTKLQHALPHRGVRRAKEALLAQLSAEQEDAAGLRLDDLAQLSKLSKGHFPHAFRRWLGISPHAYFNLSRLNPGRRMLEQGMSATEVAAALAFADLPHFSRRFRRQFGLSPREWSTLTRR